MGFVFRVWEKGSYNLAMLIESQNLFDPTIPLLVCYPTQSRHLGKKKINTFKDILVFCSNKTKELELPQASNNRASGNSVRDFETSPPNLPALNRVLLSYLIMMQIEGNRSCR